MNKLIVAVVGWLLIGATTAFYGYGIVKAISLSWAPDQAGGTNAATLPYPEVLSTLMNSLQALLLANLGAALGIAVSNKNSALAGVLKLTVKEETSPMDIKDKIQLWAVLLFLVALIACTVTWIHNGFSIDTKEVVPLIATSGQMFLGVLLAYVTALLSR
jgi:hypothetical protein